MLGPSGCGKTTTLRMIGGFEDPHRRPRVPAVVDVTEHPPFRARREHGVPELRGRALPRLTPDRRASPSGSSARRSGKGGPQKTRVGEILELVQLTGLGSRRPTQLSGGQQQRVALGARARQPARSVLLLDEPLGALDLKLRKHMQIELKRIQHERRHHVRPRHPRPGRGDDDGGHDRRHERRPDRAARSARRRSTSGPRPRSSRGFLGASNLLPGTIEGADAIRLVDGTVVVSVSAVARVRWPPACGPEKITIGAGGGANELPGTVSETAYIGVATQVVVRTAAGVVHVFAQNMDAGGRVPAPGTNVVLSWAPESTFVVDRNGSVE